MNTNKIVAALVAALSVGSSFAGGASTNYSTGTVLYIAGSTALANQSVPAIHTYATTNGYTLVASDKMDPSVAANVTTANLQGSKIALWTKVVTATNGSKVTVTTSAINMHLLGSEGGTLNAASKVQGNFLPLDAKGKVAGDAAKGSGQGLASNSALTIQANPTITFSDVDQLAGRFSKSSKATTCVNLTKQADLAAINFAIVATTDCPLNNITDRQLQALLTRGNLPLSYFTGNTADTNIGIYIAGRDLDSGTRIATFTECGFGALNDPKQYIWNVTTTNYDVSLADTINTVAFTNGAGGYFSGGDLCKAISYTKGKVVSNSVYTNSYLIGYTSAKDLIGVNATTNTNVTGGVGTIADLKALSYNGVNPYSAKTDAAGNIVPGFQNSNNVIASGAYSLWSVGRMYINPKNAKGDTATLVPNAAADIAKIITNASTSDLGYGYVNLNDMKVGIRKEGDPILPKN